MIGSPGLSHPSSCLTHTIVLFMEQFAYRLAVSPQGLLASCVRTISRCLEALLVSVA